MSKSTISMAIGRCMSADPSSPIALFLTDNPYELNAVFANTVRTQRWIAKSPDDYLGSFHRESDFNTLLRALDM